MAKKASDPTLNEDCLKYLEYRACEDGWFEDHKQGWDLLNRLRVMTGLKKIRPINEPSANYFESDGEVK